MVRHPVRGRSKPRVHAKGGHSWPHDGSERPLTNGSVGINFGEKMHVVAMSISA